MTQQLLPLSDEDRRVLTEKRTRAFRLAAVFVIATLLLLSVLHRLSQHHLGADNCFRELRNRRSRADFPICP